VEEREVEHAALLFNLPEHAADDGGLLAGEAAGADGVGERGLSRAQHGFPSGEAFLEGSEGAVAVGVARRLREDDGDEHVERVGARRAAVGGDAVGALKVLDDVAERLLVREVCGRLVGGDGPRARLFSREAFRRPPLFSPPVLSTRR
jgi:hypothetical protein